MLLSELYTHSISYIWRWCVINFLKIDRKDAKLIISDINHVKNSSINKYPEATNHYDLLPWNSGNWLSAEGVSRSHLGNQSSPRPKKFVRRLTTALKSHRSD